jgi:hypothetical protein
MAMDAKAEIEPEACRSDRIWTFVLQVTVWNALLSASLLLVAIKSLLAHRIGRENRNISFMDELSEELPDLERVHEYFAHESAGLGSASESALAILKLERTAHRMRGLVIEARLLMSDGSNSEFDEEAVLPLSDLPDDRCGRDDRLRYGWRNWDGVWSVDVSPSHANITKMEHDFGPCLGAISWDSLRHEQSHASLAS